MKLIFSYLGEFMNDIAEKFRQPASARLKSEEEYTYRQLTQYIAIKNSKSIIVLSIIGLFTLLLFLAERIINKVSVGTTADILYIASYMLLFVNFAIGLLLNSNALSKRQVDFDLLKKLFYLFWGAYCVGLLLLAVSQIISYSVISAYFILFVTMLIFANMNKLETLVSGAVVHLTLLIAYIIRGSADRVMMTILLLLAYLVLSATLSERHSTAWIDEKKLSTANERCKQMADKDLYTGLLNKSGLMRKMKEQTSRGGSESTYAVILADIDDFRKFGILYGDEQANSCLYNVCNCMRIISKAHTDIISRFGEDDFVFVLKDISEYDMISLSEQLRDSVETMALPFGDNLVTVTLGVSYIGKIRNDNAFSVLLQDADKQLVFAKKSGKNCIGYKGRIFRTDSE